MIAWLLGIAIVGLIALYLVNPPIQRIELSVSRFLRQLPEPPKTRRLRLSPRRLVTSPLFWLQLLILLLLLTALLAWQQALATELGPRHIGVLLAIDSSASMTATQGGMSRLDQAKLTALEGLTRSQQATQGGSWCVRLATFDLAWRELPGASEPTAVALQLAELSARPLGSDLELVRTAIGALANQDGTDCIITNVLVVTDLPEPAWRAQSEIPIVWQDISTPATNVGFSAITPVRNQLSGAITELQIQISAYGQPPAVSRLTITSPSGQTIERPYTWGETRVWEERFVPELPGDYQLTLQPDGVYTFDDSVQLRVNPAESLLLDWRLADTSLPEQFGWEPHAAEPMVRVISLEQLSTLPSSLSEPLLVIGEGFQDDLAPQNITDFDENSGLLQDVNLDVAEQSGIRGLPDPPEGFVAVLSGGENQVWLAERQDPPAVYVPSLPLFLEDDRSALSQTLFFNALRELLGRRSFPPLYTLTSDAEPEPAGNRIALHPDEGDTSGEPRSAGTLDDWQASSAVQANRDQLWPPLLLAALVVFLIERLVTMLWGRRWN